MARISETRRLLVATDFDGTIAPIVDDPALARPVPQALESLCGLAGIPGTVVAVVSGRAMSDLKKLLGDTAGLVLVGSHGAETAGGAAHQDTEEIPADAKARLARLRRVLQSIISEYGGVQLEPKPTGIAVHLRGADRSDADAVTAAILDDPAGWPGVHLLLGKMVLELSVIATDKGRALHTIARDNHCTATLFIGDDVTDENAFGALSDQDVGVKVGPGQTAADVRLDDPARVADLLHVLAALRRRAHARFARSASGT